jgi:hypothetical protein
LQIAGKEGFVNLYPYISRLVDQPPDLAKAAFDAVASECAGEGSGSWEIVVPSGMLELHGPGVVQVASSGYVPHRKAAGVLRRGWSGLGSGVPVELELFPWSMSRAELGLTAMHGRWPRWLSVERYLEVGGQSLDGLRAAITAWPDSLLGGLLADWEKELALGGH